MESWQTILLAAIQGITEFLPISSSAHLVLPGALFGWPDQGLRFDAAVHAGTLLAIITHAKSDLSRMTTSVLRFRRDAHFHLAMQVALGTVPIVVVGGVLADLADAVRSMHVIAATTILFAILLWFADRRGGGHVAMPTYPIALIVGLAQTLALIPGTSRSGVTIMAALLCGMGRTDAARFSFLLAIPAILGALLLTLLDPRFDQPIGSHSGPFPGPALGSSPGSSPGQGAPWADLALGFVVAAATAYACIKLFMRFVARVGMMPFVIYRIALGITIATLASLNFV